MLIFPKMLPCFLNFYFHFVLFYFEVINQIIRKIRGLLGNVVKRTMLRNSFEKADSQK